MLAQLFGSTIKSLVTPLHKEPGGTVPMVSGGVLVVLAAVDVVSGLEVVVLRSGTAVVVGVKAVVVWIIEGVVETVKE